MSFLIGGFSAQQYKSYLNPSSEQNQNGKTHWVTYFNLARYPVLAVLVNRIAYFFLHHFAVYPNNAYLFQKFKSHEFSKINTQAQYDIVKEIFAAFRNCSDFQEAEFEPIEEELDAITQRLEKNNQPETHDSAKEEIEKLILNDSLKDSKNITEDENKAKKDSKKKEVKKAQSIKQNTTKKNTTSQKKSTKEAKKTQQIEKKKDIDTSIDKTLKQGLPNSDTHEEDHEIFDPEEDDAFEDSADSKEGGIEKTSNPFQMVVYKDPHLNIKVKQDAKPNEALAIKFKDFHKAWFEAYEQAATMHAEFSKAFLQEPVKMNDEGMIICTIDQCQWVIKTLAIRFPKFYHLAFDTSFLDIDQTYHLNLLARAIFVGVDVSEKGPDIESPCWIYLEETVTSPLMTVTDDSEDNPWVKSGSFIFTLFASIKEKAIKEVGNCKKQLNAIVNSYVSDWLEQTGAILEFDGIVIQGGQSSEKIKSSNWVFQMREVYTKTLKSMSPEELQKEIQVIYKCPLVRLIAETYAEELNSEDWITSKFPTALMNELFKKEIRKAKGNQDLQGAIRKTIDDAVFSDANDIQELAKKANVPEDCIEPLIRIRVFYMMCCLGQNITKPIVQGLHQRTKKMYDPNVCKTVGDPALICESNEKRYLKFDANFDELTVEVQHAFTAPHKQPPIAHGKSTLTVSSISQLNTEEVEVGITDLQDLRFSLFSCSTAQMRYLVAQMNPSTLFANITKLEKRVANSELVKKVESYEKAKKDHTNKTYWSLKSWIGKNPFDFKAHQDFLKDSQCLDDVLCMARELLTYLNTGITLKCCHQLHESSLDSDYRTSLHFIENSFTQVLSMLGEIYPLSNHQDKQWNDICLKIKELRTLLNETTQKVKNSELDYYDNESPSPISSDDEFEEIDEDCEDVIGVTAVTVKKTLVNHVWDYTFGAILNETSEKKYLRWKIQRYEDLITGIQSTIIKYIESNKEFINLQQLIVTAKKSTAPEWMIQVLPILKFCRKELRSDQERMNIKYLEEVRNCYTDDLLIQLRHAANWAKSHPQTAGAEHINAICYQLYATLDINQRCQKIFQVFLKLGEAALGKKTHTLPSDPRYALIEGLHEAHAKIQAVPNDAKAPKVKQWANSARGHLNGFMGVTAFDPNMQSNPMHLFFNKLIKFGKDGVHIVKDIAMGSPTIETGIGKPEINPEFQAFLRHCKAIGHSHLYINNQDFIPKVWVKGDEAARCQALHDLANDDFKDTLFVITLSQNSPFYQQLGYEFQGLNAKQTKLAIFAQLLDCKSKGLRNYLPAHMIVKPDLRKWMINEINRLHQEEFKNIADFDDEEIRNHFVQRFHEELSKYVKTSLAASPAPDGKGLGYSIYDASPDRFKEELIAQMFDHNPHETGNCIPVDLVAKFDLREWSVTAADQIHANLFANRKNLTVEERRIFIRLFYQNLSRKILIETEVNSYNSSCKDRIDRGAATDAEDFAYLAILANCMNLPHVVDFFKMLVFARAIIVRKRTIIEERLDRLIETVRFMLDHQKQLQDLQNILFPDVEVTIDQFELKEEAKEILDVDSST